MDKHLIFHFYLTEDFEENIANIEHFKCLKYYSHVFQKITFVISTAKNVRNSVISRFKHKIIELIQNVDIAFKTRENTCFYEAQTFHDEIVVNLDKIPDLVFFAHNKGYSNVNKEECNKESIISWIHGLYFYSLNAIDEMEKWLCISLNPIFYGSFLEKGGDDTYKAPTWYIGTFYWINPRKAFNRLFVNGCTEYTILSDRTYAECFPGYFFEYEYNEMKSMKEIIISQFDFYKEADKCVEMINKTFALEEEYKNFESSLV